MAKHETQQKQRADGDRTKGGKLRSQPADPGPAPMASTGGRATPRNTRSSMNSRSSNSGRQAHGKKQT